MWWAGFYGLIAVSLGTTVADPDTHAWQQSVTWFTLFAATSLAACALAAKAAWCARRLPAIAASGGLFVVLVAYLLASDFGPIQHGLGHDRLDPGGDRHRFCRPGACSVARDSMR